MGFVHALGRQRLKGPEPNTVAASTEPVIRTRVPLANSISIVPDAGANMRASAAIATDANELPQLTHCLRGPRAPTCRHA